jgi:hypothetical protein
MPKTPPKPVWGERRRYDLADLRWHKITEGKYYIRLHFSPTRGPFVQLYKGTVSINGIPLNTENNIIEFAFAELTDGEAKEPPEAQRHVNVRRARAYTGRGR